MLSDEFMNAEDVARYLNLGKNTVYQLAKTGQISSYRVGRKLKFTLEDVDEYIASTHRVTGARGSRNVVNHDEGPAAEDVVQNIQTMTDAASFGELAGDPFVIAGGDVAADFIASSLNAVGIPAARLVQGSYTALVNLYAGEADAAVVHLYDQKTNSYNIPYARSLAPGTSVRIIRLYGRQQGLIVRKGNPKNLTTWGSLLREGVRLSNRVRGCGARVLLDEKLRAMEARSESIEGYDSHADRANTSCKRVISGMADVAIGTEREASRYAGLEFVPLQMEWVDLVMLKREESRSTLSKVAALFEDDGFRNSAEVLGPCDLSKMGTIIYES